MRGRKRDQCILTAYIATMQTFGEEVVVAVLGGSGQFHALLGEAYVRGGVYIKISISALSQTLKGM